MASSSTASSGTLFNWTSLPEDIRIHIMSYMCLPDAFAANLAHPHPAHSRAFRMRIEALRPLREAWVTSHQAALPSYANPPHLASQAARIALSPTDFSELSTLTLRHTNLSTLSPIHELGNLRVIDASYNNLTSIPLSITGCKQLRVLNLGFNKIQAFPSVVMHLPHLCTLLLHNNPINSLPSQHWLALSHLYRLGLFDCQLTGTLPDQLCHWLATPTEHGRNRSANLQRNNFDPGTVAHLFNNFPQLSSAVTI